MSRIPVGVSFYVAFAAFSLCGHAAERIAAELFPASTVFYGEMPAPGKLLPQLLDHPLAQQLAALPEYERARQGTSWQRFESAVQALEKKLDLPWAKAVESLTSGGLYVGVDLPTQGVIALAQTTDGKLAKKARDALLDLVRADAAAKGRADPVQEEELSGTPVHVIDKLHLAVMGKWLLVTNKRLAAFLVLENHRGTGSGALAGNAHFQSVLAKRASGQEAWVYADLRILQQMRVLTAISQKKSNNPLLELLVGGIVGLLPDAAYATASAEIDAKGVKITATLPGEAASVTKPRAYYFDPAGQGGAPALLKPEGTLLTVSTYRDLGALWRYGPDLFDDRVNARMAQAEGQLTTFFAGRDFRDDILGNVQPQIQLVVARQDYSSASLRPAIKLPAAGVVLRLKNPESTSRVFKVTFQSLIGFLNVIGGMKKVEPLEMSSETVGDAVVVSTQFLAAPESEAAVKRGEGKIHFNASPTAVFVGDRFILASAKPLALALLDAANKETSSREPLNTQVLVDGKIGQSALAENRELLLAQNMLSKGHDRAAAEKEIDSLLGLFGNFQGLSLTLATQNKQLTLTLETTLANGD